jgi:uncharacterized damage-inducible protein DinB
MENPIKEIAFCDLDRELTVTRRVLERLPQDHFNWKLHEKSMTLGKLAMHVANLPQWMRDTLEKDELDFANPPAMRNDPTDLADVLHTFDQNAAAAKSAMTKIDDAALQKIWTLRNGQQILHTAPRHKILRLWCLNHLIHHRAQLCVYLRTHNIPVPAVYFNSADEPEWTFT